MIHTIRFGGTVDVDRLAEFTEAFAQAPQGAVLVDLTRVEATDSVFIAALLQFRRVHVGAIAVLVVSGTAVEAALSAPGVRGKLDVHGERAAAVAALGADLDDDAAPGDPVPS